MIVQYGFLFEATVRVNQPLSYIYLRKAEGFHSTEVHTKMRPSPTEVHLQISNYDCQPGNCNASDIYIGSMITIFNVLSHMCGGNGDGMRGLPKAACMWKAGGKWRAGARIQNMEILFTVCCFRSSNICDCISVCLVLYCLLTFDGGGYTRGNTVVPEGGIDD